MTDRDKLVEAVAIEQYRYEMDWPDIVSREQAAAALTCAEALGEHDGDCTDQPATCLRCERENALKKARAAFDAINAAGYRVVPVLRNVRGPQP